MEKLEVRIWDKEFHRMKLTGVGLNQGVICGENVEILLCAGITDAGEMLRIFAGDILDGDIPTAVVCFGEYDNHKKGPDHEIGIGFYLQGRGEIISLSKRLVDLYNLHIIGNVFEAPELIEKRLSPER